MKAMYFERFGQTPEIRTVPDPTPAENGAVIKVEASGLCRSDWHGWIGHDDISLPHVPGHEFAGVVAAVGRQVRRYQVGDRVTVPFVSGCGHCSDCHSGDQHVCSNQVQPGFTHWGSFAEYVAIPNADLNLVHLPETMEFATAASLGCRFVTSFRAIVDQGRTRPGEWVAVHGCGGIGLSAIMIATALGANVVAIDVTDEKLEFARQLGAVATIKVDAVTDVADAVRGITGGGAHVSVDALGHSETCVNSIRNLRRRGRHIQVGLMLAEHAMPAIPMGRVLSYELELYGSHGIQAWRYDALMNMLAAGKLAPQRLVKKTLDLQEAVPALMALGDSTDVGISVITRF